MRIKTTCQNTLASFLFPPPRQVPQTHPFLIYSTSLSPSSLTLPTSLSPSASSPHALSSPPPIHKDVAGPSSGASSPSLAPTTSESPSWHRVNYSLRGNHRTPVSLVYLPPTTRARKKMSLLPWWCQVMDFMFARGVQVKNLAKPSKVTFTAKASFPVARANMQAPTRTHERRERSTGFHVRLVCLSPVIVV